MHLFHVIVLFNFFIFSNQIVFSEEKKIQLLDESNKVIETKCVVYYSYKENGTIREAFEFIPVSKDGYHKITNDSGEVHLFSEDGLYFEKWEISKEKNIQIKAQKKCTLQINFKDIIKNKEIQVLYESKNQRKIIVEKQIKNSQNQYLLKYLDEGDCSIYIYSDEGRNIEYFRKLKLKKGENESTFHELDKVKMKLPLFK